MRGCYQASLMWWDRKAKGLYTFKIRAQKHFEWLSIGINIVFNTNMKLVNIQNYFYIIFKILETYLCI